MREGLNEMSEKTFRKWVQKMVDTYGVHSYLDNEDDVEDGELWVECPECGDPILYDDWADDWDLSERCPICEALWDY